jgi:hypothetical protein
MNLIFLTAFGAWVIVLLMIVFLRDHGFSFFKTIKSLFPAFTNAGYVYFFSLFLTFEIVKQRHLKSEFFTLLALYCPALLTDDGIKIAVLVAFLLAETYFQLQW